MGNGPSVLGGGGEAHAGHRWEGGGMPRGSGQRVGLPGRRWDPNHAFPVAGAANESEKEAATRQVDRKDKGACRPAAAVIW